MQYNISRVLHIGIPLPYSFYEYHVISNPFTQNKFLLINAVTNRREFLDKRVNEKAKQKGIDLSARASGLFCLTLTSILLEIEHELLNPIES